MAVPLVTRSTLEVVLPEAVVPKLVTKSRNKLAQISEVKLFLLELEWCKSCFNQKS